MRPMQPPEVPLRPAGMLRVPRALVALSLALALASAPIATVNACSCASGPLPEAVQGADLAIVGTPFGTQAAGTDEFGGERVLTTWAVELSRDPIAASQVAIESWADSGANCGISFAAGERWLVLAYAADGGLETNSCAQNRLLNDGNGRDPIADIVVADVMTEVPSGEGELTAPLDVPAPVFGIVVAALLLGAASLVAFRRAATR